MQPFLQTRRAQGAVFPLRSVASPEQGSEAGSDMGGGGDVRGPKHAVSFSAAGLLFPYHVGVAEALVEDGVIREETYFGGCSAGAIVSALYLCGMPWEEQIIFTKRIYEDLRENGYWLRLSSHPASALSWTRCPRMPPRTAKIPNITTTTTRRSRYWLRLASCLRSLLDEVLPEDCHERCSGRMVVALTEWRMLPRPPRAKLISDFESKEDLLDALIATTYTPLYAGPDMGVPFREARWHSDGALLNFVAPTGAEEEVVVVPTPWPFSRTDITPLTRPGGMTYRLHFLGEKPPKPNEIAILRSQAVAARCAS